MTKNSLQKKQASTLPMTTKSSLWEVKEHPTQRGLSFPCFVVPPPTSTPRLRGTTKRLSFPPFVARYADNLLLRILGCVDLLIEIQKHIAHFLQSGLNLWVDFAGSTTIAAWIAVEFLGTVIREVPLMKTPIQFLREMEKRLRAKHRIHIRAYHLRSAIISKITNLGNSILIKEMTKGMSGRGSLLDAVQLAETLGTTGVRSPQVRVLWGAVKHIRKGPREILLLHSSGQSKKAVGEGGGHWVRSISSKFPIQIEAPIKKILRRLWDRGLINRRRPWLIHVACLTNVSDGDIVNLFEGIAISPLSYFKCYDNVYHVPTIVHHQIRWSAILIPAYKHKSSARNIILMYSKDSNIVNQEGGKTLAEFPNNIDLGKLESGQDQNNNEHSTTSKRGESGL
uniref:Domain X domain-containing protein n=1 Tax=Solanum lycopersicum TaxID=4081 RepID=K4CTA2_SOLLC